MFSVVQRRLYATTFSGFRCLLSSLNMRWCGVMCAFLFNGGFWWREMVICM